MNVDKKLKENLIADVENICCIELTNEQKTALERCFEITIGVHELGGGDEVMAHSEYVKQTYLGIVHKFMNESDFDNVCSICKYRKLEANDMPCAECNLPDGEYYS